ncbi:MAG: DUF4365 domain-containing protein [Candidatus Nanopelagicales bacterium]
MQRKQSRPTRARGKAGFRRLEAVLEAANIVVQQVATENDIGRDAFVDIVDGTDVTGGVVCIQIKSGRASYCHNGTWVVPGKPADFTLWRESTVPFFGVIHDEVADALRWVDLSEAAGLALDRYLSPVVPGPFGADCVPVPEGNRLDVDLGPFLAAAEVALRRRSGMPVAALLADDVDRVVNGIVDTFAMGRHDPTPFLLLAALLHRLPKATRRRAVGTLAMTTSHPDVLWHRDNWVPDDVSRVVRGKVRWAEPDLVALLEEIDEAGIERGTFGQTVFHVLTLDQELGPKLFRAALDRALPDGPRFWAAAILLYLSGDDAAVTLERLFKADETLGSEEGLFPLSRAFQEVAYVDQLVETVEQFGHVSFF